MLALAKLSHVHRFVPAADPAKPPLLLLHGTGGDETDLLPLGQTLSPGSALLSPRGQVLENGRPRFFRRLAEGVFDEADVRRRAAELAAFVGQARVAYGVAAPLAVGFSNGANVTAALLLLHPAVLAGAVLIRPMVPLAEPPAADLAGAPVLVLTGALDPIVPPAEPRRLVAMLHQRGAVIEHRIFPAGHNLSQADVTLAWDWIGRAGFTNLEPEPTPA